MLWGFPCLGYFFFSVEVITLQSSMNVTLTKQPAGQDYLNTNTGFPLFSHITSSRRSEFPDPTGGPRAQLRLALSVSQAGRSWLQ